MKRFFFAAFSLLCVTAIHAQIDHKLPPDALRNDSIIKAEILRPFLKAAQQQIDLPDWKMLRTTIVARFDAESADRNVTKARIYYYYNRDWAQFCKAIVQYTQTYEYRDSLSLMNMNAKMILDHSTDPGDWKAAQSWVKYAVEKDPVNRSYKATLDALTAKIDGK